MSSPASAGAYAGLGFSIEFIRTLLEVNEPFFNGIFGALGALVVKILYDIVKYVINKKKNNEGKIE